MDKKFGDIKIISTFAPTVLATLPTRTAYQGGTSLFIEGVDMEYRKMPIDFPQQIETLRERGMEINDEGLVLRQLNSISYFRLSNYWRFMEMDSESRRFRPNSRFEDVIDLYLFDRKLSDLIFTILHDIEITLRTRVIHHFSMKYGAFWFMEKTLFKDEDIYENCLSNLNNEISPNGNFREEIVRLLSTKPYGILRAMGFPIGWEDEALWKMSE